VDNHGEGSGSSASGEGGGGGTEKTKPREVGWIIRSTIRNLRVAWGIGSKKYDFRGTLPIGFLLSRRCASYQLESQGGTNWGFLLLFLGEKIRRYVAVKRTASELGGGALSEKIQSRGPIL